MEGIIQIKTQKHNACYSFDGLPLLEPVHVAIVAADGVAQLNALRIFDLVRQRMASLASQTHSCHGPRLLYCRGRRQPGSLSLLVMVTDVTPISRAFQDLATQWVKRSNSPLLAIIPPGADITNILPAHLAHWNALTLDGGPAAVANAIEVAAGMVERRLFISYRRSDTQALADQLFDALGRRGYRVYLDRFVGSPGRQFPQQIVEELVDKGAVLVLESPGLHDSAWTLAEVAVAHLLRLGLFAVQIPDGITLSGIPHRMQLASTDMTGSGMAGPGVSGRIVEFVSQNYMEQSLLRRLTLKYRLQLALAGQGLITMEDASGTYPVSASGNDYHLHLSTRPPGINDMRKIVEAGGQASKIIIGPHRLQPPNGIDDTEWLAGAIGPVRLHSEWRMAEMARAMRGGTL